jgi:CHAT domain-containing protein
LNHKIFDQHKAFIKGLQSFFKRLSQWRYLLLLILFFLLALSPSFLLAQTLVKETTSQSRPESRPPFRPESPELIQRAKTLYQSEQFAQSAEVWQQSAAAFAAQGDRLNQAMALSNLSLSAQKLGRWDQATQAITQSLNLLQSQKRTPTQQKVLAATLDIQGQLQRETGQSNHALKTWEQAESLYTKLGDKNGKIASQINQTQALQDLGLYPRACQTVMGALGLDSQGCDVPDSVLQTLNETQPKPLQILGLRSLGNILRIVGQTQQSQNVLQKSWQLAQSTGDTQSLSSIYLGLGNTARALGNKAVLPEQKLASVAALPSVDCAPMMAQVTATELYRQAAACYRKAEVNATPSLVVQAQLNLLNLSVESQQWAVIPELLPNIQTRLTQLPPSRSSISAELKYAQSLMCLQAGLNPEPSQFPSPILQSCDPLTPSGMEQVRLHLPPWSNIQSLVNVVFQQSQTLGDKQSEANALGYLAGIAQQTGNLAEAKQLTEQALQKISAFEVPELAYLWQWQLGRLYQLQGSQKEAIAAYSLSFSTLQSLRRELVATDSDIQFTFRESVEPVYRELVDLHLQAETPSQNSLRQARDIMESLQLAELNNFFREACIEARTKPIDRIDPKAAVVYGIILPKRLAVIVSLPGNKPLRYYETSLNPAKLAGSGPIERTVEDLFATLNPYVSTPDPLKANQQLYDWLIRPVEAELKASHTKTLVFVLDGVLRGVPVAALHDGQHYLIEDYGLALTPGLQLLSSQSLTSQKLKILLGGLAAARQGFSPLPGVQQEIKDIAGVVPTNILLDGNFTRTRIQAEIDANPFPIIHLATHAQFSSRAEDTFLLTWDERINVKNLDQFLRERNRLGRKPIELLILSACQTAVGDKRAALGLAGVAVRSGARSTLATLWSVQDQSTADLMTKFYGALNQAGSTKADALRQAQLSLMQSPQYNHPFYWAPFVLVGNWL